MKKRVKKSEIEIAKKSSRIMFLLSFILLVFLFVGFGLIYVLEIDVSPYVSFSKEKSTSSMTQKIIKKGVILDPTPISVEVDITDSNVQKYYNIVKVTNQDVCVEGTYREKKHVDVKDLSEKCKFSLASKIYEKNIEQGLDGRLFVSEEDVKSAYDGLFGHNTYEPQDSIPCLYNTSFIYHGDYYFTDKVATEEGTSLQSFEKILNARRVGDQLDITTAVVFYERVISILCKDSRCESTLETVKQGTDYDDDYYNLYVDYHKDSLYQYTYHFEMDDAGFYRYIGYDRTNE